MAEEEKSSDYDSYGSNGGSAAAEGAAGVAGAHCNGADAAQDRRNPWARQLLPDFSHTINTNFSLMEHLDQSSSEQTPGFSFDKFGALAAAAAAARKATGSGNGPLESPPELGKRRPPPPTLWAVEVSHDGFLLLGYSDGRLELWDVASGTLKVGKDPDCISTVHPSNSDVHFLHPSCWGFLVLF